MHQEHLRKFPHRDKLAHMVVGGFGLLAGDRCGQNCLLKETQDLG